ncbi:hypothetical protein ACS0TY_015641 [Phlomoides rotata]
MHFGLYRTTLAAAPRLISEFAVYRIEKTMSRGMKSSPAGKSLNSPFKLTDDNFPPLATSISTIKSKRRTRIDLQTSGKQKSEEVRNNGSSHREASTPMSDSPSFIRPKQRSIDHEHVEAKPISADSQYDTELPPGFGKNRSSSSLSPEQRHTHHELGEAKSISESNQYDTELPTEFWNNRSSSSRSRKQCHTHHEHGELKRRLTYSPATEEGEPFDICFPETRKTNSYRSSVNDIERSISIEEESAEESGRVLRPGMVLFKHYISISEQVDIVTKCRELGCGPGGFYRPGYKDGAKLRLHMMCLGLDWDPQTKRYGSKRHHDDAEPPVIPQEFTSLVCRVIDDSHSLIKRELKITNVEDKLPAMSPDVCIVNYYNTNGRLGLHQDRDESEDSLARGLPVVSISLGDSAEFLYGDQRDIGKAESVELESGDILVFGGESRHIFHGVTSIYPDTAPPALLKKTNLRPGRLNLTFRKY